MATTGPGLLLKSSRLYSRLAEIHLQFRVRCYSSKSNRNHPTPKEEVEELYSDLNRRINKYRKELLRYARASFQSRQLTNSINNLRESMAQLDKRVSKVDSSIIASAPSNISLEILSNGTCQLRPCIIIRTPLKVYLFNCPEGTSRFLPSLRLKSINIQDIFLTRGLWDNIGGISSILLSKEQGACITRLHGPLDIRHYLECIRPFTDSDFTTSKYPTQVEELSFEAGCYSDAAITVKYIPLSEQFTSSSVKSTPSTDLERLVQKVDISYLIELNVPPRRINPAKLCELRIPSGPHIGRLKMGETVTLSDGRVIKGDDVLYPPSNENQPHVLVTECSSLDKLQCLKNSSQLQKYVNGERSLNYLVHFTSAGILNSDAYKAWMHSFGENCWHLIANGTGPVIPHIESIYRNQSFLSQCSQTLYPPLLGSDFDGIITQDDVCERDGNILLVRPLQRFPLRGSLSLDDPIIINLKRSELKAKFQESAELQNALNNVLIIGEQLQSSAQWPRISFLGTSSAVPSKYRNVSGYYLEFSDDSAVMVDCGEGTYGQLRALFTYDGCQKALLKLNCILVTHAHQDHMNGLYTMIFRRYEAFREEGIAYKPLVVVCNFNVLNPLRTYSRCFENLEPLIVVVNISQLAKYSSNRKRQRPGSNSQRDDLPSNLTMDVTKMLPRPLFSCEKWNLSNILSVRVHHTRMAVGYVFTDLNGRKVVFSGDTMPCDLLIETGKDADILVHESTFQDGHEKDALFKKHSTMKQAVDVGIRMRARHVILTHFSARYPKVPPLPSYLDELGNVSIAFDNLQMRIGDVSLLEKMLPVYRKLYHDELFEIEMKTEQRILRDQLEASENEMDLTGNSVAAKAESNIGKNLGKVPRYESKVS